MIAEFGVDVLAAYCRCSFEMAKNGGIEWKPEDREDTALTVWKLFLLWSLAFACLVGRFQELRKSWKSRW